MYLLIFSSLCMITTQVAKGDDVCAGPFSGFLQCMADESEKKIGQYSKEVSPEIKQAVQECFTKNDCEKPDFTQATLSYFLKEPWLSRASDIFDLLENVDEKVKHCMMRYFLDVVRTKINECLKEQDDVKDFEMPPLPDIRNIDITKIKEVVVNRLMVRKSVSQCNESKGEEVRKNTIDCILKARNQYDQALCSTRATCREQNITDQQCRDRFDKVHSAVCECTSTKGGAGVNARDLLLSGKMKTEFKKCHEENNVPYPQDKVNKVQSAITQSARELLSGKQKIPQEVKQTLDLARIAFEDLENRWKKAFCADCGDKPAEIEANI